MHNQLILKIILVIYILFFLVGCNQDSEPEKSKQYEKIVMAVTPWPGSAALYVAREKGFFQAEGIDVVFHSYVSGHLGLEAMISGKADLSTAGDTPIARSILDRKQVALIATICEINRAVYIVAGKDRGISLPSDLRGKKVGVVAGTTADFFLHIFLTTSYVDPNNVRIIPLKADSVVDALTRGEVDAVCTWPPHTFAARDRLGPNAVILDDPDIYKMTWNIATTRKFSENHPEYIEKFLRAVVRANKFIARQPGEAHAITAKGIGSEGTSFKQEWEDYTFAASLSQSLILNLEDQIRWMIKEENKHHLKNPPNIMDFIYTDGLRVVQPAALRIQGM